MIATLNTLHTYQNIILEPGKLIHLPDNRSYLNRIKDFSIANLKEFNNRWQRQHNPLNERANEIFPRLRISLNDIHYDEYHFSWKTSNESQMLVVFIHGLNSSPLAWSNYLKEFPLDDPKASCFVPFVYKRGYCQLKTAADPILDVVQDYANDHPHNPIFLVGHSNGARIAAYLEQKIHAKCIRLISIAGPHCGSKLINWMALMRLTQHFGFTREMVDEYLYKNPWVTNKLIKWQNKQKLKLNEGRDIKRIFFAAADDWRIFPTETSFPYLPNSEYHLMKGESHVTIIDAVANSVVAYISKEKRARTATFYKQM